MKYAHAFTLSIATVSVLMFPAAAHSTTPGPVDPAGVQIHQEQQNGISYMSGGIGLDEARFIQQSSGYNLHMSFSVGSKNEYLPNEDVVVQNSQGHPIFTLNQAGPLVYVQLPAGKYTVVTTRHGEKRSSSVDIGNGSAHALNIHWSNAQYTAS
jgi:hypothetical protein